MNTATTRRLAWALAIAAFTLAGIGAFFVWSSWHVPLPAQSFGPRGFAVAFATVFGVTGLVLATKQPQNPIGWLILGASVLAGIQAVTEAYATYAVAGRGSTSLQARMAAAGTDWVWILGFGGLLLALALFPDGAPLSPSWGRWIRIFVALIALDIVAYALSSRPLIYTGVDNPIGVANLGTVANTLGVGFFGLLVLSTANVVIRFRRATGDEREQMKWLTLSLTFVVAAFVLYLPAYAVVSGGAASASANLLEGLITVSVLTIPLAIGVAIMKYRLYEIDVVIRKTVVFAILVLLVMGVGLTALLVATAAASDFAADRRIVSVVAFLAGISAWPLYRVATRIGDRVVFRGRATPYEVLTSFTGQLGSAYATDQILPQLAEVLATGVGAQSSVVWLMVEGQATPAATWPPDATPPPSPPTDAVLVRHQGEVLGALSVRQPPDDPMNAVKQALMEDLANQTGIVLRNVGLIEELRRSRRRIVSAQDERAKQLERNIHDGVQQQLVALNVQLGLLARVATSDPTSAAALATELQERATDALEDLRDLARGIYPPLLADKGLGVALEAQARKTPVATTVEANGLGRYDESVESAVYFCVLEALNNIAKYADAHQVQIRLWQADGGLTFEVRDDGVGFDTNSTSYGTGLQGMADRVDAIGGVLRVTSSAERGTTVSGTIPV